MDIKKTWLFSRPIAHRGLHNTEFPENSIGAFLNAVKNGYPIELDVRIIDDGSVVVFHDETLSRMAKQDGYVGKLSKENLVNAKLHDTDGEPTEWHIPTFEDVLEAVAGQVPILIETKGTHGCFKLEEKTLQILRGYRGEYAVQSFDPYSMGYFKDNALEIPRGQLSKRFQKNELEGAIKRAFLRKLRLNRVSAPDFISYCFQDLPNKYVTKTKLPTLAWTIRSNTDYESIKACCDNIIFENFIPQTT